jgi:hypothetical protein
MEVLQMSTEKIKMQKTTGEIAKKIAKQITTAIGADSAWSDNANTWISNILSDSDMANSFFSGLTNTIVKQQIISRFFNNPLERFKTGELPFGLAESEFYINPQTGETFLFPQADTTGTGFNADLLKDKLPDIKQIFFKKNYGKKYKKSYSDVQILNVVQTWDDLGRLIDGISRSLVSDANIEEFDTMKAIMTAGFNNGDMVTMSIADIVDKATAEAFLVKAREKFLSFQFPSTDYNTWTDSAAHKVKTWSDADSISIILTAKTSAVVDVYALAAAFNIDKADIMGKVFVVDKIDDAGKVNAILFDDSKLHFEKVLERAYSFFNPDSCSISFYYYRQAILALDPFANCIAFTSYNYTKLTSSTAPADWATNYNNYYTKSGVSGDAYIKNNFDAAPTYAANTYYSRS